MTEYALALAGCALSGALASVHPCPLVVNVAAVTALVSAGRHGLATRIVIFTFAYVLTIGLLGWAVVGAGLALAQTARGLQDISNLLVGPVLIIVGMLISGLITVPSGHSGFVNRLLARGGGNIVGAIALGVGLALSFCPTTAALFFGVLAPLALQHDAPVLFPLAYAVGLAVPLAAIAGLVAKGITATDRQSELWARVPQVGGLLLILLGLGLTVLEIYV